MFPVHIFMYFLTAACICYNVIKDAYVLLSAMTQLITL